MASRPTAQQAAVRQALVAHEGFRSAQEVYADLRVSGHRIGLSTVYRHLQGFSASGVADVIHTADGETAYRLCHDGGPACHHHHLVCRRCGRAEEIEGPAVEAWATETAERFGYVDVEHTVEVFGICHDCA